MIEHEFEQKSSLRRTHDLRARIRPVYVRENVIRWTHRYIRKDW